MIFYIESNGFCATHWLSEALSALPGVQCFHGTRSLPSGAPLGAPTDLPALAFAAELARLSTEQGITAGAIHGKFGPGLRPFIKHEGGHYGLAVRHPVSRVNSCAAWAKAHMEAGRGMPLVPAYNVCTTLFKTDFGLDEVVFAFAIIHIINYDRATLAGDFGFDAVYRMEDYTTDAGAMEGLIATVTEGMPVDPGVVAALVARGGSNLHAAQGRAAPEHIFTGWSDKQRALFTAFNKGIPDADRARFDALGYDLRPFQT